MFGFEITSDLLIVALFAQTITIALIVLTIYFKIRKIQYKNIELDEKLDEKLDRVESKLSYLSNQILVISANQDKFTYPMSSLDPSTYYRTRVPTNEESESSSLLKDAMLYGQNSKDSRIADTILTTTQAKESETEPIPVIETSPFSHPKPEPAITTKSLSSSSLTSNHHSFSEISTSNKPSDVGSKDTAIDSVQNTMGSTSTKSFADNDRPIEKNTNPELDKIEREILTALKRLGGSDDDDNGGDSYGDNSEEDVIYPTAKKAEQKSQKH
ncbi:MAG: hypothetical protein ACHQ1D_05835 [Nitrososphaerales archaeon]